MQAKNIQFKNVQVDEILGVEKLDDKQQIRRRYLKGN